MARGIDPSSFEHVASSYRKVAQAASQQLNKAAMVSRLSEARGKSLKKVKVPNDDNVPFLPRGATVHLRTMDANRLKPGSFIIIRRGSDMSIRRFIRLQVTTTALLIHVAKLNGELENPITTSNFLGHVQQAEFNGRSYDPTPPLTVRDYFTEFGTCTVGTKLGRMLKMLLPARLRKITPGPRPMD